MYWNLLLIIFVTPLFMINRNMRCIEMFRANVKVEIVYWLIETWDVLKYLQSLPLDKMYKINRNMRCIEILKGPKTNIGKGND